MLLGYIVAKVCTSPRNSTRFTRPFLLMRGCGLGTRLEEGVVWGQDSMFPEVERAALVLLCKLSVLLHLLFQHRQSHHTIVSPLVLPLVLPKSFLASTACRLSPLSLLTLREKSFEYGSWLLPTNRKRSKVSESCSGPSPS